ncbi:MAG TPA: sigma-70 family RNA polymerase sigma factor [Methylomirabilota bacterium]|nr:sigma-70 family RNA polymerase sigma factor [Methylomirabilota bacterium]
MRSWSAEAWVTDQPEGSSDEALCRRVAARDEAAFDLLVARYQGRAYRLAWSMLRDAEDARDVSQDAFIRIWDSAGRFRGDARFSTWFYRILVNLCLDHRRRRRWWALRVASDDEPLVERQPAREADPGERVSEAQAMARLWDAVHRLSPRQRAAVILHTQEQLSTAEIAEVLGCAEATVRVHLHRAVAALRKMVER